MKAYTVSASFVESRGNGRALFAVGITPSETPANAIGNLMRVRSVSMGAGIGASLPSVPRLWGLYRSQGGASATFHVASEDIAKKSPGSTDFSGRSHHNFVNFSGLDNSDLLFVFAFPPRGRFRREWSRRDAPILTGDGTTHIFVHSLSVLVFVEDIRRWTINMDVEMF